MWLGTPTKLHWDAPALPGRTAGKCSDFLHTTVTLRNQHRTPYRPGAHAFTPRPSVPATTTVVIAAVPNSAQVILPLAKASQRKLDLYRPSKKVLGPPLRVPKAPTKPKCRVAASAAGSPGRRKMRRKQGHE